jgi:hypothetical protein
MLSAILNNSKPRLLKSIEPNLNLSIIYGTLRERRAAINGLVDSQHPAHPDSEGKVEGSVTTPPLLSETGHETFTSSGYSMCFPFVTTDSTLLCF